MKNWRHVTVRKFRNVEKFRKIKKNILTYPQLQVKIGSVLIKLYKKKQFLKSFGELLGFSLVSALPKTGHC